MKRIFLVALISCLSACASQPAKTVAVHQPAVESSAQKLSAIVQPGLPAKRAYLDDYDLVPVRANVQARVVQWLSADEG